MRSAPSTEPMRVTTKHTGAAKGFARLLLAILVSVVVGNLWPLAGAAQPPPPDRRHHHGPPLLDRILERNADQLKLDEATRERIRAIAVEAHGEARPLHDRLRESREEMRRLLGEESPDEAAIMRQAERIGGLETEVQKQRLRTMLKIRALLTAEQRRELVKIHEERRRRWRGAEDEPQAPSGSEAPAEQQPAAPAPSASHTPGQGE
jgi:Spy/CpxP family protein refolding chaperone